MRIVKCPICGHIAGPPRYPTDEYVPDDWVCDYCELQKLLVKVGKKNAKLQARVEELEKWKTIMQSALEAKVRQVRRLLRET